MSRQIVAFVVGVVLSFLSIPVAAYVLYHMSGRFTAPELGAIARFVVDPLIGTLVGGIVGAEVGKRPALVAALSLLPWALAVFVWKKLSLRHELIVVSSSVLSVFLGAVAASVVFRARAGKTGTS